MPKRNVGKERLFEDTRISYLVCEKDYNGVGGEVDQNLIHDFELASADFGSDRAPPHMHPSEVPHFYSADWTLIFVHRVDLFDSLRVALQQLHVNTTLQV